MRAHVPTERAFGLSVGGVCVASGVVAAWRGHTSAAVWLIVVGGLLLAGALLAPSLLRVPNRLWWRMAQALGWINSRVLLTLLFVAVLTPLGLVLRSLGRSPLHRPAAATNWSRYPARNRDAKHYQRMF
jgi:hypothetical protein